MRCAPDKVERVLFNLLTNALRHTPADGAVAVVVRGEGGQVLVAVDDSGAGLAPGAEERMFDSFWRGEAARSADGAVLGQRDRAGTRARARRAHLGREPPGRRRAGRVHAAGVRAAAASSWRSSGTPPARSRLRARVILWV